MTATFLNYLTYLKDCSVYSWDVAVVVKVFSKEKKMIKKLKLKMTKTWKNFIISLNKKGK